ncbi:MAG: selenium cofactor biosynthesis protein YqeC [Halobacteriales archaeon]
MDLVGALEAARGTTCVVGAGGKKSTLFALAERVDRAVVTATVRIPIFDRRVASVTVTDDPISAVRTADEWPVGVVAERNEDRYEGYDPAVVDELAQAAVAEAVLVKADGARTRWLKAPGEHEPRLPRRADVVVPVASVKVVGEPLDAEHVHRPERVAAITDLDLGNRIGPADVAAVLASENGGRHDVPPDATVVPLLNMVDDPDLEATARTIADELHRRVALPRVVLTRLIDDDPVVGVVEPP